MVWCLVILFIKIMSTYKKVWMIDKPLSYTGVLEHIKHEQLDRDVMEAPVKVLFSSKCSCTQLTHNINLQTNNRKSTYWTRQLGSSFKFSHCILFCLHNFLYLTTMSVCQELNVFYNTRHSAKLTTFHMVYIVRSFEKLEFIHGLWLVSFLHCKHAVISFTTN